MAKGEYSGTTNVRLGPALHAHLAAMSRSEDVSLNHLIVTLLAGSSNFTLPREETSAPVIHKWGSPGHVEQIAERLGTFESWHLQHELQMGRTAAARRLKEALKNGVIEEVSPAEGAMGITYRFIGPSKK